MKTSLICLLLLAAVAWAAPQAGEMPGAKRVGMTEKMREKMAEKRKEIAEKMRDSAEENGEEVAEERQMITEKMREMAEEKREESENAVAAAKSDGEEESRYYPFCYGVCYGYYGEVGCLYDQCYYGFDVIYYDYPCVCCSDYSAPYCYYK